VIQSITIATNWTDFAKVQTVVVDHGADSDFLRLRFLMPDRMGYLRGSKPVSLRRGTVHARVLLS
jgi:hypothetical protein